ncbi:putative inactive G-type lectin S-receptor-like serine/threonine-protein kinase SRK [Castanea sativa]|uniref:putative inactive G-type lectin S-receptor-like serine/threonine-protein kinase SRK n=1 Tax=Castanea sativa TaxID=21020 RepID=UPI003F6516AB
MLLVDFIGWFTFRMRRAKRRAESSKKSYRDSIGETQKEDLKLPLFDLETVSTATNKFSFQNKIGQGGFGPVYKVKGEDKLCEDFSAYNQAKGTLFDGETRLFLHDSESQGIWSH